MTRQELETKITETAAEALLAGPLHRKDLVRHLKRLKRKLRTLTDSGGQRHEDSDLQRLRETDRFH